jgi:hypothetical protein
MPEVMKTGTGSLAEPAWRSAHPERVGGPPMSDQLVSAEHEYAAIAADDAVSLRGVFISAGTRSLLHCAFEPGSVDRWSFTEPG